MSDAPPLLVLGAGGLLGHNLLAAARSAEAPQVAIPWEADPSDTLAAVAGTFGQRAGRGPWRVAWCAGAGVVGTSPAQLATETRALRRFLDALRSSASPNGTFFLASSAGGVHAGVHDDPVTEHSPVLPLSAYGEAKVEQERMVRAWAAETGVTVAIGRFSNLYGPGQDLTKAQGLISRLVRASLRGEPLLLFVPLDTVRDYLFAPDAARRAAALIERVATTAGKGTNQVTVKLIASGRTTTVGELIAEIYRIRKRRPPVVFGVTTATGVQPPFLRFRSAVWPDLDRTGAVTLGEGIAAVVGEQLDELMVGAPS